MTGILKGSHKWEPQNWLRIVQMYDCGPPTVSQKLVFWRQLAYKGPGQFG